MKKSIGKKRRVTRCGRALSWYLNKFSCSSRIYIIQISVQGIRILANLTSHWYLEAPQNFELLLKIQDQNQKNLKHIAWYDFNCS
jgi:hypothetical protein